MSQRTTNGGGAGLIVFIALKVIILIARVGPDIARAVPPPRFADDVAITRSVVDGVQLAPDIVDVWGAVNDDD